MHLVVSMRTASLHEMICPKHPFTAPIAGQKAHNLPSPIRTMGIKNRVMRDLIEYNLTIR